MGRVLKRNGNMQLAYTGIGKALVGKGEYRDAMKYFKLAMINRAIPRPLPHSAK